MQLLLTLESWRTSTLVGLEMEKCGHLWFIARFPTASDLSPQRFPGVLRWLRIIPVTPWYHRHNVDFLRLSLLYRLLS